MKYLKKKKQITKNNSKPSDSVEKPGVSTNLQINAEIVNGTCPHCRARHCASFNLDQLYFIDV